MRDLTKFAIAGALICAAGAVLGTAYAGNLDVAMAADDVEYFSERINYGDRLVFNGPAGSVMLVDDITYKMNMVPDANFAQGLHPRYFVLSDLDTHIRCDPTWVFGILPGAICGGSINDTLFYTGVQPPGAMQVEIQRWTKTWHGLYGAHLSEILVDESERPFDGISHNNYAQLMATEEEHLGNQASEGGVGIGVGMMGWMANTSESRHYQTPEIIEGLGVELRHPNANPSVAPYNMFVDVFIRGRVVSGPSRPTKASPTVVYVQGP